MQRIVTPANEKGGREDITVILIFKDKL